MFIVIPLDPSTTTPSCSRKSNLKNSKNHGVNRLPFGSGEDRKMCPEKMRHGKKTPTLEFSRILKIRVNCAQCRQNENTDYNTYNFALACSG